MAAELNSKQLISEKFASIPETVEQVETITDEISRHLKFSEPDRDSIAIAITEAVNNAIYHGNKLDEKKKVHFAIHKTAHGLRFIVGDEGSGFKPDDVPNPLEPDNLLKENGRGIFILKSLMDEVSFDFSPRGTTITLVKNFNDNAD